MEDLRCFHFATHSEEFKEANASLKLMVNVNIGNSSYATREAKIKSAGVENPTKEILFEIEFQNEDLAKCITEKFSKRKEDFAKGECGPGSDIAKCLSKPKLNGKVITLIYTVPESSIRYYLCAMVSQLKLEISDKMKNVDQSVVFKFETVANNVELQNQDIDLRKKALEKGLSLDFLATINKDLVKEVNEKFMKAAPTHSKLSETLSTLLSMSDLIKKINFDLEFNSISDPLYKTGIVQEATGYGLKLIQEIAKTFDVSELLAAPGIKTTIATVFPQLVSAEVVAECK